MSPSVNRTSAWPRWRRRSVRTVRREGSGRRRERRVLDPHRLRCAKREVAVIGAVDAVHDVADQRDEERVTVGDLHCQADRPLPARVLVPAVAGARRHELGGAVPRDVPRQHRPGQVGVDVAGRAAGRRRRRRAVARRLAHRVDQPDLPGKEEAELEDAHEDEHEDGQDERELRQGLPVRAVAEQPSRDEGHRPMSNPGVTRRTAAFDDRSCQPDLAEHLSAVRHRNGRPVRGLTPPRSTRPEGRRRNRRPGRPRRRSRAARPSPRSGRARR